MQLCSYGPTQPPQANNVRIPHARERDGDGSPFQSGEKRDAEPGAKPGKRTNTSARESGDYRDQKEGFGSNTRTRESGISPHRKKGADNPNISRARGTWGGARNRGDRVTTALSQRHAEGVLQAMAVADLVGMPLTRHWTVDYERAGIADWDGAAFVGRLLAIVGRFARVRGGRFAAVWVREVGVRNGAHVHIAFHLPRGWRLGHFTRRWIRAAGGKYVKGVSHVRPIGGSLNCAWTSPEHYRENLEALGNYFLKGSDVPVALELGLDLLRNNGAIVGKRCGRTQNLKMVQGLKHA